MNVSGCENHTSNRWQFDRSDHVASQNIRQMAPKVSKKINTILHCKYISCGATCRENLALIISDMNTRMRCAAFQKLDT